MCRLNPVDFTHVKIENRFWTPRQEVNRCVTIPHQYRMCKETERIDAFKLNWKQGQENPPHIFWDSDVAKWVEAAAYTVSTHPDPELGKLLDEVTTLIANSQQADGYLNVHYTVVEPDKRWANLRDCHELYCAGHLMEAAVTLYQATGKRHLLDALCRYADYIDSVFGRGKGKKRGYCGHEEIELALVKLYQTTGNRRYLKLAKYFVDERGRQPHYFHAEARERGDDPKTYRAQTYDYCQAHKPLRDQSEVVGHAVRAFYIYSGMADVAALTGDCELLAACKRLWDDLTQHKLYLTGGIGPSRHNEGFTRNYDLPNETAYAETCAAIALVFFAHRMLQIEADSRYADVVEQALYNGVLSGVSLDGTKFFYENPLASLGNHHRQQWFGCACCPPNVARLLASLGQYVYSTGAVSLYTHLYVGGQATTQVAGQQVTLTQETNYPWDGDVSLRLAVAQPTEFDLMLRIPRWCSQYAISVNGKAVTTTMSRGYVEIRRTWKDGDTAELTLSMPVERVVAHPKVLSDVGKVALQRGPIVYCLEECDNPNVLSLRVPKQAKLTTRFDKRLLGGMSVVEGEAMSPSMTGWKGKLYTKAEDVKIKPVRFRAIPYFAWDNREPGAMAVWVPTI
ncbi:MAG: glycoside hydrolase family 127 protein [Armatimonadetes bacterium]|nr:glycoside hydrolase family 127 protein [Armatimonadota bacterium]